MNVSCRVVVYWWLPRLNMRMQCWKHWRLLDQSVSLLCLWCLWVLSLCRCVFVISMFVIIMRVFFIMCVSVCVCVYIRIRGWVFMSVYLHYLAICFISVFLSSRNFFMPCFYRTSLFAYHNTDSNALLIVLTITITYNNSLHSFHVWIWSFFILSRISIFFIIVPILLNVLIIPFLSLRFIAYIVLSFFLSFSLYLINYSSYSFEYLPSLIVLPFLRIILTLLFCFFPLQF